MKKVLFIVIYFSGISFVAGQTFKREQVIGTWISREVAINRPNGQPQVENIAYEKAKRGLINSKFIFRPNGLFLIQLPPNAPSEFHELESMNNKMWHIRAKEQKLFVGTLDEDLMMINVKITNGTYYFLIEDSPLVLKMERTQSR
jgi:hypothetical protein